MTRLSWRRASRQLNAMLRAAAEVEAEVHALVGTPIEDCPAETVHHRAQVEAWHRVLVPLRHAIEQGRLCRVDEQVLLVRVLRLRDELLSD